MSFLKHIPSSDQPDEALVLQYRQSGDLKVLGELYSRYMDLVYGVCLKYVDDADDAKDCTLQIFEELIVKLQRHEVEHFRAWLYQLAKNHCLMRLRSEKKLPKAKIDPVLVQSAEPVHLNGALEREEAFEQLQGCLEVLSPDQRQAIELFYLKGKCYNEICEETGMDWKRVRSLIQNGRRNLKICMEQKKASTA